MQNPILYDYRANNSLVYRVIRGKTRIRYAIMETDRSILIVEDEGLIALHLMEILTHAGYRVSEPVASGEEALKHLEERTLPHLILMDITLDGSLDGIETAREIRKRYTVPIIFLTAHSNSLVTARAKEVSPCGYIVKPVMEKDLLDHVERALNKEAR